MRASNLIPLKQALDEIGVSRTTLWRALNSEIDDLPKPVSKRRRLYWRTDQIEALSLSLDLYQGRGVFEKQRRRSAQRADRRFAELQLLKSQKKRRHAKPATKNPGLLQGDLFTDGPLI